MSLHVRGPLVALVAAVGLLVATTVLLVIGQRSAADAAVSPGTTVRASVRNDGSQATGGGSQNALSADGRFVAFQGVRLDPRDAESDFTDVYVRDLVGGTTTLISTGPEGAPGRGTAPSRRSPRTGGTSRTPPRPATSPTAPATAVARSSCATGVLR